MTEQSYGVRSSVAELKRVAVRRPLVGGPEVVAQYEQAHWQTPDLTALSAQHEAFVATLRGLGSEVIELDPVDGLPDAVFVYDPAFVIPSGSPGTGSSEMTSQPRPVRVSTNSACCAARRSRSGVCQGALSYSATTSGPPTRGRRTATRFSSATDDLTP